MKRGSDRLMIILFLLLSALPYGLWMAVPGEIKAQNFENRILAEKPQISTAGYLTFSEDYEAYLNDHLPFRNTLVMCDSAVRLFAFDDPINEGVLAGKEGWLFFCGTRALKNDYLGTDLLTEEELDGLAAHINELSACFAREGRELVILIAPNKERIYQEYMPDALGTPQETCRLQQITEYLQAHTEVPVVTPVAELRSAKGDLERDGVLLYYKTDTHWNGLGGYIAVRALLNELEIDLPDYRAPGMEIEESREGVSCDLADQLQLRSVLDTGPDFDIHGYDTHGMQPAERQNGESYCFTAGEGADGRTVFVCHDSFIHAAAPVIGSSFAETHMMDYGAGVPAAIRDCDPDLVILEVVERQAAEYLMNFEYR